VVRALSSGVTTFADRLDALDLAQAEERHVAVDGFGLASGPLAFRRQSTTAKDRAGLNPV
jgi:hypothetical protein